MMDSDKLMLAIRKFCEERDWRRFHNPKDLAIALSTESAELLELFLWKNEEETKAVSHSKRREIEDEVADIAIYLFDLVDVLDLDLETIMLRKLEQNRHKYPVELAKGKNLKYNEL